jgi:hypothetical protein
MAALLAKDVDATWFSRFFGARSPGAFIVVPGMCNGGANYGPRVQTSPGHTEFYAIIGASHVDSARLPSFSSANHTPTIIHEFNHSFVNPLVDRLDSTSIAPAGLHLYTAVASAMRGQAYGNWRTMLSESLVRASVARYRRAREGDAAAAAELREQYGRGFLWIRPLDSLLGDYERSRSRYPTMASFMPRIVAFFRDQAEHVDETLRALNAARPHLVAVTPASGDTLVDPATDSIVLTFDRPMGRGYSINYGPGGKASFPQLDTLFYDSARTQLTMRVRLEPGHSYEMRVMGRGFQSAAGVPLGDTLVTFRTGNAKPR